VKLEAAGRKLGAILASAPATGPTEPLSLRQGAIREAVIEVLMEADEALAPIEVRRRAASRIGRAVKPHAVIAALAQLARDPDVLIAKVGPAQRRRGAAQQRAVQALDLGEPARGRISAFLLRKRSPTRIDATGMRTDLEISVNGSVGRGLAADDPRAVTDPSKLIFHA
jgi:hypothetical protein